jgi:hypothetical protein
MTRQKPLHLEPWMAAPPPPELVAAARRSAAERRCTGVTRKGTRCERRAIRGARRCRIHLGPNQAHDAFHTRRHDEFCAGQLGWEGWDFQRQQRCRNRLGKRLGERSASRWPEPGLTLVFSKVLEDRFRDDLEPHLRRHARDWEDLPDAHRDRARWAWRRLKLDRPGALSDQAWDAKADYLLVDVAGREKKWSRHRPENYDHVPDDSGNAPWLFHVTTRSVRGDRLKPTSQAELNKALALPSKVAARYARTPRKGGWPKGQKRFGWGGKKRVTVEDLDVSRFLQEHARALAPLISRCPDEDQQKRLAYAYRDFVARAPGAAVRWVTFLRSFRE